VSIFTSRRCSAANGEATRATMAHARMTILRLTGGGGDLFWDAAVLQECEGRREWRGLMKEEDNRSWVFIFFHFLHLLLDSIRERIVFGIRLAKY
jgi:hypothetical protein